jgi:hypothetical protein
MTCGSVSFFETPFHEVVNISDKEMEVKERECKSESPTNGPPISTNNRGNVN